MRGPSARVNCFWGLSRGDAFHASQRRADERRAAFRRGDPWTDLPRRIVADMLRVAALEIGDPVLFIILMKSDNPPEHPGCFLSHLQSLSPALMNFEIETMPSRRMRP